MECQNCGDLPGPLSPRLGTPPLRFPARKSQRKGIRFSCPSAVCQETCNVHNGARQDYGLLHYRRRATPLEYKVSWYVLAVPGYFAREKTPQCNGIQDRAPEDWVP